MVISYDDAQATARSNTEPGWSVGTYCMDDRRIIESDEYYVFVVGAREYLVDGDEDYAIDGGVPVVYKEDGHFTWLAAPQVGLDPTLRSRENPTATIEV